jgi:NAD(P)-dependent dehydrogenase (short-subunit alcohol dehydrogenase family)
VSGFETAKGRFAMNSNLQLNGRVAIVTGGSRGIGAAVAGALLARGMRVAITGRSAQSLASTAGALDVGDRLLTFAADVRRLENVQRIVSETTQKWGRLDVLVNNAGIGTFGHVADMSPDDWRAVIDTNLTGVFYCCHEAIPHLKQAGGGWIINISSLAGKNAFVGGGAYCASKAGLNQFSEALMQEVRYDGIRVSYIMPGSVDTDFGSPNPSSSASSQSDWKIAAADVAAVVLDLLDSPTRTLASRIEMRPSQPRK